MLRRPVQAESRDAFRGRDAIVQALQSLMMVVVAISELDESGVQFLGMAEAADPQNPFLEDTKEALDTSALLVDARKLI